MWTIVTSLPNWKNFYYRLRTTLKTLLENITKLVQWLFFYINKEKCINRLSLLRIGHNLSICVDNLLVYFFTNKIKILPILCLFLMYMVLSSFLNSTTCVRGITCSAFARHGMFLGSSLGRGTVALYGCHS